MKSSNFLSMALIVVLMVVAVGCTTMQGAMDEYEERPGSRRVILNDPYYSNTTYLVRDPYTGMYYEVRPYGYSPYSTYPGYYDSRYYGNRNNRYYRNSQPIRRQSPQQQQKTQEEIKKSRETILGKKQ